MSASFAEEDLPNLGKAYASRIGAAWHLREDAAQEFVIGALSAMRRKPDASRSFVHQAGEWAANAFLKRWTEERRNEPVSLQAISGAVDSEDGGACSDAAALACIVGSVDPLDDAIRGEEAHLIRAALASLPEKERIAVERHVIGGERLRVVATALGIGTAHAQRLVGQALARLRPMLADLSR